MFIAARLQPKRLALILVPGFWYGNLAPGLEIIAWRLALSPARSWCHSDIPRRWPLI